MKLLETCAGESSVHGLPHLVAKDRHWSERIFWAVIVILSIYYSYAVCLTTWTRYQESPTVLTLQTDYRNWILRPPAVTICPTHIDLDRLKGMIKTLWNVDESNERYSYYLKYLETITTTTATAENLGKFKPFANDTSLQNISMLDVAFPKQFVHAEDDIMTATGTIGSEMQGNDQVEVVVWVTQVVASASLKNLTPARRKCLYAHETKSYFKIHSQSLCRVDCRVRKAMQLCGCIPFFYTIVSFGGAAALFLGCSFLSGVEFVYFFLEFYRDEIRTHAISGLAITVLLGSATET
ncbi:uncharacterized protein LOC129752875 [Uranotaenia lowii]|uniref:uncharacterized protein LOC129752875 n=1 Tax=Uranotaenia lowii TaxID=190385 RepID=UPI00247ADE34|nr:uncharacterized protein LOC129752875 [Uranotaenia lowii]